MANDFLGYQNPTSVDEKLDTELVTVGANDVHRERIQIAGSGAAEIAPVSATDGLLVNLGANNDVTVAGVSTAAKQDTIIGHLDGVEGLLTTIDTDTGNIATSVANIDTDTTTIIGHLDGVEGLLTTIDADTSNIATSVANIDTDTTTIIGHLDGVEGLLTTIDADTGGILTSVQLIDNAATTIGTTDVLRVALFDNANNQVTSFGGGTQYTEADTDASITGTAMMMEGAANALVPAQGTAADGLLVNLGANNDVTVTGTIDLGATDSTNLNNIDTNTGDIVAPIQNIEAAVTNEDLASNSGDSGMKILAIRKATPANTSNLDGDYEFLQMSAGRLWTSATIDTALPAGTNNIGDVDVLSVIPGTGATNLGKAIDTATGATDTGVLALVTRDDALSALTPVEGDNVPMRADANGALHMNMSYKLDSTNDSITAVSSGNVAHDAVDSGNPVKIGGKARSSEPANVAADDRVDGYFDLKGRQIVAQKAATGTQTTVAGSASNVTLLAANTARLGASIYNDSTAILYVRLQATATTSNFTTKMQPDEYFEVPFGYTGIIDGIWASATGNARVTEIT